jgi:hypothetical protein
MHQKNNFLLYLRSIKYNYIMAGKDVMDIKVFLEKIKK